MPGGGGTRGGVVPRNPRSSAQHCAAHASPKTVSRDAHQVQAGQEALLWGAGERNLRAAAWEQRRALRN